MVRLLPFAAGCAALAILVGACGGGDDDKPATSAEPAATATATKKPDIVRTTPTAVPDSGVALTVVQLGGKTYSPTVAEFRGLPTSTVNGKTGVTLKTLIDKGAFSGLTVVTIDGTAPGGTRGGSIRFGIDEVAKDTIFILGEQGHLNLVSASIPESQWLTVITAISLR